VKRGYSSRKIVVNNETATKKYTATPKTDGNDEEDIIFPIIIHQRDSNCSSEQETKDNEDISASLRTNHQPFKPTETQSCDSIETIPFNDNRSIPLSERVISNSVDSTDFVIERVSSSYHH
jgi:hypothetical protein